MNKIKKVLQSAGLADFDDERPKPQNPTQQKSPLPSQSFQVSTPAAPVSVPDVDLAKFIEHFDSLLKGANLPGPDYYEFAQVLEKLLPTVADEKLAYTAAFASLALNGMTKDKVIQSAKTYMEVIAKDRDGFQTALKKKIDNESNSRKSKILEVTQTIETNKAEIDRLLKLNEQLVKTAESLQTEISTATMQLQKNEGGFLAACDTFTKKIETIMTKSQQYIS